MIEHSCSHTIIYFFISLKFYPLAKNDSLIQAFWHEETGQSPEKTQETPASFLSDLPTYIYHFLEVHVNAARVSFSFHDVIYQQSMVSG